MHNRNDPTGLVERSMKNLAALETMASIGADVHLVTQLVLSLLALVVFPRERAGFGDAYSLLLKDLEARGWPKWDHHEGKLSTLRELLIAVRHAVSHGNVAFSSEGRAYDDVYLEFTNRYQGQTKWRGGINASDLRVFCDLLGKYILN